MILPEKSGQFMTVRYRCGQSNDLPSVMQFLSANKCEKWFSYLLADKTACLEGGFIHAKKYKGKKQKEIGQV